MCFFTLTKGDDYMSKNNSFLSDIGTAYIIYKLRWLIIIGIILFAGIFFFINKDMDKEYQEYGYSGWSDNIKYDEWTGEIIPKSEIETYTSNNKYITNSKGNKITVAQIEDLLKQYGEIQGSYASFNESKKDSLDSICNILLREYFDLNYEIKPFGGEKSKSYRFQIIGDYEDSYYSWISSPSDLRGLVKEVFKDKYCNQNGIDK